MPSPAASIEDQEETDFSPASAVASETMEAGSEPIKIGFVSLGCPKNLVDSEVMMGFLNRAGVEITSQAKDADVIVVNTCSFIDSAKQESVNTILEMAQQKVNGRAKKLVVAGCLVERYGDEIRKNIPEVDEVIATGQLEEILTACGIKAHSSPRHGLKPAEHSPFNILPRAKNAVDSRPEAKARESQGRFSRESWPGAIVDLPNYLYDEHTPRVLSSKRSSAYIKIAEGCDHPCSFCIIPQLRGRFRSRQFESVVREAERLTEQGIREITLVGQDTTCYGEDLGMKDGLARLLERMAQIEELRWVRFLYAYPNKITPQLLETIAAHAKICPYIDMPLQHAAGTVLKKMKRGGSADLFLKSVNKMRLTIPNLTLRTSFIVGFPGETERDFDELCDFVRAAEFDWVGVFSYSDQEGAAALAYEGKLPNSAIEGRRKQLMRIQRTISKRNKAQLRGREFDILMEGPCPETELLWEGRTIMHAPEIDGKVFINDFGCHQKLEPGDFYRCVVTESFDYDLAARII